jgi:hypothetical protein
VRRASPISWATSLRKAALLDREKITLPPRCCG